MVALLQPLASPLMPAAARRGSIAAPQACVVAPAYAFTAFSFFSPAALPCTLVMRLLRVASRA